MSLGINTDNHINLNRTLMEREFKNHMNALSPNTTYVVSENCTVANHLSIPIGVSLIFKGGMDQQITYIQR